MQPDSYSYLVLHDMDVGYKVVLDEVVGHDPHPAHFQRRQVTTVHRTVLARVPFMDEHPERCICSGQMSPCPVEEGACPARRYAASDRAEALCKAYKRGGAALERIRHGT